MCAGQVHGSGVYSSAILMRLVYSILGIAKRECYIIDTMLVSVSWYYE